MPADPFADVMTANAHYAGTFGLAGLQTRAARGLAVVTCMDSRIDPLGMLGLRPGDAKILRNAGARVTEEVLGALVLAVHLLDVSRILVVGHTGCRMVGVDEQQLHATLTARSGVDTRSLDLRTSPDVRATLRSDVQRIRSSPYLPGDLAVAGMLYDVDTGRLERVTG